MNWFPLALICAFSLASADALSKRHLSDYSGPELVLIRFTVSGLLLAPLLVLNPLPPVPLAFWGWVAALIPLELLAMWLYVLAIRDSPLSDSLPYLAFTPVLTTVTGLVVLGERVSLQGFAGILLIVTGAYLLNIDHARGDGLRAWLSPFPAILRERGSRLMLTVAALYSLSSVMGKGALQYVPPETFGPFYWCTLGLSALVVFCVRRPKLARVLWRRPAWHLAVGALMGIMVLTHFMALERVEVAYMIAVKRTSLLFGILYGALLFREQGMGRNLLAGALMCLGVAAIVL